MKVAAINTLLSSAMVVAAPNAVTSESSIPPTISAQSNKPEAVAESFDAASSLDVQAMAIDHWGAEKNARFKELSRNEALRELSTEELAELESLTRLRRFEKYPRSADEILWQRRQQNLTRRLVQALQAYVEFHETPRNT